MIKKKYFEAECRGTLLMIDIKYTCYIFDVIIYIFQFKSVFFLFSSDLRNLMILDDIPGKRGN